jgi:glycosyltransferase involved in cell wall biosynthesis
LIRACDLLRTKGVSFGCAIVGAGEQDGELRDLVESLDLSNEVRLLGPLPHSETLALAARASVAALACRALPDGARDGIPVSLMESMAMGIPVVSTRVSGIPELVQDGQNGVLVDQDDPAAFADALAQVLLDEEWRKVLGPAARRTVERQFDLAKTTGRMRSLLESVAPELVDRAPGDG